MPSILDIRVQKLFLITLVLKVLSSGLGWFFQFPWSLGFWVPLGIMSTYIVLGLKRRDNDVTDEKFADTCYYLGFIFTITSIIFSLFDLPNIGTRIQDIAVRFGAAMVSTVLGLGVRVYLVSFKKDVADAIRDAEDAVLDASQKFREQLVMAYEKLCDFQSQVDNAAKATVERVNMQVEALSKNHADKLTGFFTDLTNRNQEAFAQALGEVKTASLRLSESVDGYSQGMRANLGSIEAKVTAFTSAVTDRLKTTTFPDDYFAKHLDAPLTQLKESANVLAGGVKMASAEVSESSVVLSGALKKLRQKANATEGSLETVLKLTEQQQAVLDSAQGQLTVLGQLTSTLSNFDAALSNTLAGINASNVVTAELTTRVSSMVAEGAQARQSLEESLAAVVSKLDANATAATSVAAKLDASATATNAVTAKLGANASATELIADKLDGVAAADVQAAATLGALGQHATAAIGKVDQAVEQLQGMVRQLSALDSALRAQSSELKQVAERIKDVKVIVEVPPQAPPLQRGFTGSSSPDGTTGGPNGAPTLAGPALSIGQPGAGGTQAGAQHPAPVGYLPQRQPSAMALLQPEERPQPFQQSPSLGTTVPLPPSGAAAPSLDNGATPFAQSSTHPFAPPKPPVSGK